MIFYNNKYTTILSLIQKVNMIPYRELIVNPDKYKPLGSVKAVRNVPCEQQFVNVDLEAVFMDESNLDSQAVSLHQVHRQNGGRAKIDKFLQLVPKLAVAFKSRYKLNEFEDVDYEATGQHNWVELLKTINNEFMRYCYKSLRWNNFVPTREWAEVGPADNRKQKRFYELTAEDIPTLDYWRHQEVQRMNKAFRNNNKIPFWQASMHTRHFDRDNGGFRYDNPDRSSLDTFVHNSYDMSQIHETLDKWTKKDWFGM